MSAYRNFPAATTEPRSRRPARKRRSSSDAFPSELAPQTKLGFDVKFQDLGRIVVLQFKLGEELKRFHRADPTQSIPSLSRPFWRYKIDTTGHQFRLLEDLDCKDRKDHRGHPEVRRTEGALI